MKKPIIAIMYDFDKTLCTRDMQEYTFIPKVGMTAQQFWDKSNALCKEKKMDAVLAYMYQMLRCADAAGTRIRREDFVSLGRDLEFFPGVESWFDRMDALAKELVDSAKAKIKAAAGIAEKTKEESKLC